MRVVLRMFLATMALASSAVTFVACSGGGGGITAPQGPPPPPFAITLDTGLAVGFKFDDIALIGKFALIPVSETETGSDLNNDGDTLDWVAHLLDVDANTAINLRLAITGKPVASNLQFAFLVPEFDQNADLNGDSDLADAVWHLLDPTEDLVLDVSGPNPLNTSLATPRTGKPGVGAVGGLILIISEMSTGADFSGDGDATDDVVIAIEHFGNSIVPLGIPPHAPGTPLVVRDNRVMVCGSEAAAGMDLTGDLDATDIVLGVISFDGPGVPAYMSVGAGVASAIDPSAFSLTADMGILLINEASSGGADINADGDSNDSILALVDLRTGATFFPTANSVSFRPLAANINTGFATSANRLIFGIDENAQGKDINNDQDTIDSILAWIDVETAPTVVHSLGLTLGSQQPRIDGTIGLVSINEAGSALVTGIDHNADGDVSDQVAFRVDVTSVPAVLRNLGLAVEGFSLTGTDAVLMISEAAQSQSDRNGDSDTNDIVPSYGDLGRVSPAFRSLGLATRSIGLSRNAPGSVRLGLLIPEQPLTSRADLNGDGDSLDNAYFWIDIDTDAFPPTVIQPTPYLIGIGSFSTAPPLRVDDDTLLFATSETMLDRDLNADGDKDDTLLRIVRRPPPATEE